MVFLQHRTGPPLSYENQHGIAKVNQLHKHSGYSTKKKLTSWMGTIICRARTQKARKNLLCVMKRDSTFLILFVPTFPNYIFIKQVSTHNRLLLLLLNNLSLWNKCEQERIFLALSSYLQPWQFLFQSKNDCVSCNRPTWRQFPTKII
jgi:hypothetical protein